VEVTLYNGGERIQERVAFSLTDEKADHSVGYRQIDLPSKRFTTIDTELEIGGQVKRVEFPYDLVRNHGKKGVVMVLGPREVQKKYGNPDHEIPEDQPYAASEASAREKGDRMASEYTMALALAYLGECDEAQAKGGVLRKAQGYIKRCLDKHNLVDPYEARLLTNTKGAQQAGIGIPPAAQVIDDLRREFEQKLTARDTSLRNFIQHLFESNGKQPESATELPTDEAAAPTPVAPPAKSKQTAHAGR
jgi:hypothetical protein